MFQGLATRKQQNSKKKHSSKRVNQGKAGRPSVLDVIKPTNGDGCFVVFKVLQEHRMASKTQVVEVRRMWDTL